MTTKISKHKIWIGVGAFVVAGGSAIGAAPLPTAGVATPRAAVADTALPHVLLAQHGDTKDAGEGGEGKNLANLPPDLAFAVRLALLRGHLLVGDDLVKQKQWNAALPHFLHPIEEIYGDLRDHLAEYKTPAFEDALKTLADVVKARKAGDYPKALQPVNDALVAADAGLKEKQADWGGFQTEAAIEAIKSAAGEYEQAVVGGRIAKPVEYQDARGFIGQGERMLDNAAADLQKKDAGALKEVRARLAELKKVFPTAMPPKKPVKDHAAVLAIIARMELAAGKLM
jgi:hypothetical protein